MSISGSVLFLLIAALAGVAMAVQGALNSAFGKIIGLWEATFIVHMVATVTMVILLFIFHLGKGNLALYNKAPWYLYLGGFIGVVITYFVVISISELGAAIATTAIIVGQVLTACMVDHFGAFGLKQIPFTWTKLIGLVLLAVGARLLLKH